MRKVLLIISFLFCSIIAVAQDFCALKQTADSLASKKKYEKALNYYNRAIEKITTYQEKAQSNDWIDVSIGAFESNIKLNKKVKSEYAFVKYGPNGTVYKNKIIELKNRGLRCVFTFQLAGGMTISSYTKFMPVTNEAIWIGSSNDRRLLIWAENNEVFIQGFDNFNIHKPVKVADSMFKDICLDHFDVIINEKIKPRALKRSEQEWIEIIIPLKDESRYVKRFDLDDVAEPEREYAESRFKWYDENYHTALKTFQLNNKTYMAQIAPSLVKQWIKLFVTERSL